MLQGKARKAAAALVLVGALVGYGAGSSSSAGPARWPATVRCVHMAEDSAAHVRLVTFDRRSDGTLRLVYRCLRRGY